MRRLRGKNGRHARVYETDVLRFLEKLVIGEPTEAPYYLPNDDTGTVGDADHLDQMADRPDDDETCGGEDEE